MIRLELGLELGLELRLELGLGIPSKDDDIYIDE